MKKLILAAAGSGKTTYIVEDALKQTGTVLLTTFTLANNRVIKEKIRKKRGCLPANITVMPWFTFLLRHGVKPYQGSLNEELFDIQINGMELVSEQSGVKYKNSKGVKFLYGETDDFMKCYFNKKMQIYSDKLSRFVCNANKSSGNRVIERISNLYKTIYIDEAQDLSGYDLEIVKLLFESHSNVVLVGDVRQCTYSTHWEQKYNKYKNGLIENFIVHEFKKKILKTVEIDKITLGNSYRNNEEICAFASLLYPDEVVTHPHMSRVREMTGQHKGVYVIAGEDVEDYIEKVHPTILRHDIRVEVPQNADVYNMGIAKGMEFEDVLIYPTCDMQKWMLGKSGLKGYEKAKFYVAITRARHSVAIVMKNKQEVNKVQIEGVKKWEK